MNKFNLIDEPWIPVTGVGLVSLHALFSNTEYRALGGNPVQKIAMTKLLLAIAQSACTPQDNDEWANLKPTGLANKCLEYLNQWHDSFYLYGEKPFLQMPAIKTAAIQSFGAVLAEVSTGNTTVLTQSQVEKTLEDADKALLLLQLMAFALGGKKTDNSIVLSAGYQDKTNDKGKPSTGKPSGSIGFLGFLHNFLQGESITETLWLNLFSSEQILALGIYPNGLGVAPWELMPTGESCIVAASLKSSLMGRLVPVSRFCLLAETGLHYSEGILHAGYKDGIVDPSISVDFTGKDFKAIWADPEKRPWRLLTALLSFLSQVSNKSFDCPQLRLTINRAVPVLRKIGIWSGGLRVSSNAGEQFVSGSDDFVESLIQIETALLGECWFENFKLEITGLETLSKSVYMSTLSYFKSQNMESKDQAALASNLFWQLCERKLSDLISACDSTETSQTLRPAFLQIAHKAYDTYCPNDTARQLDAWAKNRPKLSNYLKPLIKETV
jgi:CRISPR system Cascade subunit CasA